MSDNANVVEKIVEIKNQVANEIDSVRKDIQNIERSVSEQIFQNKPVSVKDQVRNAIGQAWNGNQSAVKALGDGFLTEEKVKEIVRPGEYFDLTAVALVKTVRAVSTENGVAANAGLGRGSESASDFAAVSISVPMPTGWQYLGYSIQEFNNSNLSAVDENVKAFFANRAQTLAKEFVDGSGSGEMTGLETYSATTTWEANKLQTYTSTDGTADNLAAKIVEAINALEPGKKIVVCNGATKSILANAYVGDTSKSYFDVILDNGVTFWQNDNFADAEAGELCAAVFVAGRGYCLAIHPEIVATSNDAGSKRNLYMGQRIGGAAVVSGSATTVHAIAAIAVSGS